MNSDVNEIFGSPLETRWHYTWIMPVAVEYAPAVKEKLYGYRLAAKVMESEGGGDCEEEKEFLLKALGEKESKVLDQEAHIGSVDGLVDIELGRDNSSSPYEGSTGSGNGGHAGSIRKRSGPP